MSLFKRGLVPRSWAVRGCVLAISSAALLAGGCAHEGQNSYSQNGWYAGGPRQQAAAVPVPVEMEDDGKPAQLPPPARVRAERDDPREPWSPNYGSPNYGSPNYGGPTVQAGVRPLSAPQKVADAAPD